MQSISHSLDRIFKVWQQDREELIPLLQPGLSPEEIQAKVSQLSLQLPQEMYELYQWHNGIASNITFEFATDFLPGFNFLSLDQALKHFNEIENYRQQVMSLQGEPGHRPWFPVFSIDVQHLIVFGDVTPQETSPVFYLSTTIGQPIQIAYPSLANLLSIVAECYETGAYYFQTDIVDNYGHLIEFLREDEPKVSHIKRKHKLEKLGVKLKQQKSH